MWEEAPKKKKLGRWEGGGGRRRRCVVGGKEMLDLAKEVMVRIERRSGVRNIVDGESVGKISCLSVGFYSCRNRRPHRRPWLRSCDSCLFSLSLLTRRWLQKKTDLRNKRKKRFEKLRYPFFFFFVSRRRMKLRRKEKCGWEGVTRVKKAC